MTGIKNHRMNHIFRENGRSFVFAMDHAALFGMMDGLESPGDVIRQVREGGADAILTSYGVSKQFVDEIGDMGLILRVDGGLSSLAPERGPLQLIYGVEDALRLGALACVLIQQLAEKRAFRFITSATRPKKPVLTRFSKMYLPRYSTSMLKPAN